MAAMPAARRPASSRDTAPRATTASLPTRSRTAHTDARKVQAVTRGNLQAPYRQRLLLTRRVYLEAQRIFPGREGARHEQPMPVADAFTRRPVVNGAETVAGLGNPFLDHVSLRIVQAQCHQQLE